jgi:hypothetical protein
MDTQNDTPTTQPGENELHVPIAADSNVPAALGVGTAASIIGAVLWALITFVTEFQIGFMAVGVGFLVGSSIGYFNHDKSKFLGYAGAILSLFGCLLGNAMSLIGFIAHSKDMGFFEILPQIAWSRIPGILVSTSKPIDLLFYGIAVYEGFRFSIRPSFAKKN